MAGRKQNQSQFIVIDQKRNELQILKSGKYSFLYNHDCKDHKQITIDISENLDVTIFEYHKNHNQKKKPSLKINYNISKNTTVNYNSINNNPLLNLKKQVNFNLFAKSTLKTYSLELGNDTTIDYLINLNGEESLVNFNLMVYADEDISGNYKIRINHLKPFTTSIANNHAVLNHQASCFFDVQSYIKKGSYQSVANQTSKILTLSDHCLAQINPQLLIDEHDVVGSHAATCGKVDEEVVYYMQSRGYDQILTNQLIVIGNLLKNVNTNLKGKVIKIIEKRIK